MAAHVGEEYGRSLASRMTPTEGQRTVRAAMHVVAETLTAHGFAAHAEDRGETTAVVAEQCPFGDASSTNPVLCAVDRGMVKGLLAGLCGSRRPSRRSRSSSPRGRGATTPAPPLPEPRWLAPTSTTPARRRHGPRPWPPSRRGRRSRAATPAGSTRRAACVRDALEAARGAGGDAARGHRAARWSSPRAATEAINAAVWGATRADPGAPVLCAAVEHSAVRDASARAAPTEVLAVDRAGRLDVDALRERLRSPSLPRPALVHCQWANHEVGTLQPVHEVVALVPRRRRHRARRRRRRLRARPDRPGRARRRPGQRQRTQARRGPGRRRADRPARQAVRAAPRRRRAGAWPARRPRADPRAARLRCAAAALRRPAGDCSRPRRRRPAARSRPWCTPRSASTGSRSSGRPRAGERLPHLICLGVHGVEAEPVLIGLDRAGVAVHSGSACSSESIEPSPVLEAMGVDPSHSLRVSVGWSTTDADCAAFADAFARVVADLRALRG